GDVSLELAPARLSTHRADRLGQVPVLRRRVHADEIAEFCGHPAGGCVMRAEMPARWIRIAGLGLAALLFGCTPGAGSRDPSAPEQAIPAVADAGAGA